ncbi:putative bifunctional diguanylate cyclase/phosphodiesterase [Stutzerimonas azotifigens]|uniref:EAL domain-containing protein n=1 Tax=Stutzerimonas azotifigens TaxID=291995 RepID=A0ABR5Z410_9GAMM|nr:GGDEF and EAL domain-containing protein [Stutzerimonas azotifigens]MBA1274893.1 EAL domain-containing protein [Stutzerimonas azotifigens]
MTDPVIVSPTRSDTFGELPHTALARDAERTRLLFRGARVPALLMIFTGLGCVVLLWGVSPASQLFYWLLWIVVLAGLRLHQGRQIEQAPTGRQAAPYWRRHFMLNSIASALALAYACVWLVPPGGFFTQVMVYGLIGSVVLAASIAYAVSLPAFFSFAVPCLLPSGLLLIASDVPQLRGWGMLALIVLATLSLIAWQVNRLFGDGLEQRLQNAQLIDRLRQAGRDAEALNRELGREVEQRSRAEAELRQAYDGLEQRVAERTAELAQSEARLNLALEASDLGLWDWDLEKHEVHRSRLGMIFGFDHRDAASGLVRPEVHVDDLELVREALVAHLKGYTDIYVVQYRARGADGRWLWLEDRGQAIERGQDGRVRRMIGTRRDVTALRQQVEQQKLAATVFEAAGEGIVILDASYRVLAVNQACCTLSGYRREELLGRSVARLASSETSQRQYAAVREALESHDRWEGELIETRRNGEVYPQWVQLQVVRNEQGRVAHVVGFISDLSLRHKVEERLRYLTFYDDLTGLANRSLLKVRLQEACQRVRQNGRNLAVLYIDLDRFNLLNESLGHEIADELLVEVSRRLAHSLSEADTLARLSGDEFVVLLDTYASLSSLARLGSRLLSRIRKPITVGGHELVVSASIGVSLMPDNAREGSALLRQANMAVQHAKHLGGNTLQFFTERLRASSLESLQLENQLRKALDEGQLELFYQPRLCLANDRLEAAEALVRWRHPQQGLIGPAQFIPLAEATGLIIPLGEFVLRQACAQARRWQQQGLAELRISVNLSVKQLRQGNLVSLVRQVLEETGLPPGLLELELTESQMLDDIENAIDTCRLLRALGVSLAIDDFGTGYSSLSYLKRFPVDYVKIDKSFIAELEQSGEDAAIIRAIIAMAHNLELKVVAEGVETQGQMDFLKAHGCDEIQGYLLSPPVEPERFVEMLT